MNVLVSGSAVDTDSGGKKWPINNFIFLSAGCFLLRADVFSSILDISKLQFLIKNFFICFFLLQFLVIVTLDPDWIQIRIHLKCWIQNPDPQLGRKMSEFPCFLHYIDTTRFTKLISSSKCQSLQIGAATGLKRGFGLGFAKNENITCSVHYSIYSSQELDLWIWVEVFSYVYNIYCITYGYNTYNLFRSLACTLI